MKDSHRYFDVFTSPSRLVYAVDAKLSHKEITKNRQPRSLSANYLVLFRFQWHCQSPSVGTVPKARKRRFTTIVHKVE